MGPGEENPGPDQNCSDKRGDRVIFSATTVEHDQAAAYDWGSTPVLRLLRDAPEFSSLPPHALRVLAWCYRYSEEVPTRDGIMRAMTALATRAK
jgi:hypothetical protein